MTEKQQSQRRVGMTVERGTGTSVFDRMRNAPPHGKEPALILAGPPFFSCSFLLKKWQRFANFHNSLKYIFLS